MMGLYEYGIMPLKNILRNQKIIENKQLIDLSVFAYLSDPVF